MNLRIILMCLFACTTAHVTTAQVGCLDNSRHGYLCNDGCDICSTRMYDNKEWHTVPCTCPCLMKDRAIDGFCIICGHRHVPEQLVVTWHTNETEKNVQFCKPSSNTCS